MKKNKNIQVNRIIFLLILFLLLALTILGKLIHVQVIKSNEYTKMALEQINRSEEIVSDRGYILDRNGKRLAINTAASTIYVNGAYIKDEATRRIVAKELAPILQSSENELYNLIDTDKRVKVRQWVSSDASIRIREKGLSGVEVVDGFRRFYPYGNLASHLIGFTNIDGVGQYGVEASYNEELTGTPGKILKSSDAANRQLPNSNMEVYDADDGLYTKLTIDQSIQNKAIEEVKKLVDLYNPDRVHIIVEEVETGDILAMHSYPSFDPNNPTGPVSQEQKQEWATLDSEQVQNEWFRNWRNPTISDIYEPGSTFKLITAAAALEESVSNPDKHYYCTGYIRDIKGAPPLRCVSFDDPHGDITLREGLAYSCNPTFVYLNRETGRENFLKYVKGFGFGEKTGIDLNGEGIGITPESPESISELSFATMSYGHGIAVTPIQLINAVSAIGNDGILMEPRVVKELLDSNGNTVKKIPVSEKRQVVSKETSETLLSMMKDVVEYGTGQRAASLLYNVGGKTGTANKVLETGGYDEDKYVSSFVGIAPIEDPKVSVIVIIDNPKSQTYGSIVASPTGKEMIEYSLETLGIKPMDVEKEDTEDLVEVPDLSYRLIGQGGRQLTNLNLKYTTGYDKISEETIIVGQSIKPGELVKEGTIIELNLDLNDGQEKILPNLIGLTIDEVKEDLALMGIKYDLIESEDIEDNNDGSYVILEQLPKQGETLPKNQTITLTYGNDYGFGTSDKRDYNLKDGLLDNVTSDSEVEDDNENIEDTEENN